MLRVFLFFVSIHICVWKEPKIFVDRTANGKLQKFVQDNTFLCNAVCRQFLHKIYPCSSQQTAKDVPQKREKNISRHSFVLIYFVLFFLAWTYKMFVCLRIHWPNFFMFAIVKTPLYFAYQTNCCMVFMCHPCRLFSFRSVLCFSLVLHIKCCECDYVAESELKHPHHFRIQFPQKFDCCCLVSLQSSGAISVIVTHLQTKNLLKIKSDKMIM